MWCTVGVSHVPLKADLLLKFFQISTFAYILFDIVHFDATVFTNAPDMFLAYLHFCIYRNAIAIKSLAKKPRSYRAYLPTYLFRLHQTLRTTCPLALLLVRLLAIFFGLSVHPPSYLACSSLLLPHVSNSSHSVLTVAPLLSITSPSHSRPAPPILQLTSVTPRSVPPSPTVSLILHPVRPSPPLRARSISWLVPTTSMVRCIESQSCSHPPSPKSLISPTSVSSLFHFIIAHTVFCSLRVVFRRRSFPSARDPLYFRLPLQGGAHRRRRRRVSLSFQYSFALNLPHNLIPHLQIGNAFFNPFASKY